MSRERILVAEDDPVTSRFLTSLLREKGYQVLVAEDGNHAYELAVDQLPDLILSDVVMPYRDGLEILRVIRRDARLANVPVIILSMKDKEEDIVHGLRMGARCKRPSLSRNRFGVSPKPRTEWKMRWHRASR